MKKLSLVIVAALSALAIGSYITAQQSGSGTPGGSSFSTQYKLSPTTFGGAGPGTAGNVLTSNGAGSAPTFQAATSVTPAALSRTNDTNVTLTLGGTPLTSLLQATSITAGWTGQLGVTRGGTGLATVAQGDLLFGSAADTLSALAKNTSATRYLSNTGTTNNPAWAQIALTTGVTGTLPVANGGTNLTASADDNVMVGNGTTWETKALTSCSAASSAVTYNTTTNAFGCNTITAGNGTVTVGTFTVTYPVSCTTTSTQNWAYIQTSNGTNTTTTVYPTDQVSCTSDSTGFNNTGGTQVPAGQRPIQEAVFAFNCANNGVNGSCVIRFGTNGSVILGNSAFDYNGAWTNSGEKDFPATNLGFPAFTYRTN